MHVRVTHLRSRLPHLHLRHAWVTAGLPGQPVNLQCKECCKVKALRDPVQFEKRMFEAAGRYHADYP